MNEFKTYHPVVNFIYFLFVVGFSMFFMHPLCLIISLFCSFTYSVVLKGKKAIKRNLSYMLQMMIAMALINPVFNHEGVTILCYLPGGNPLTFESIIYGVAAAVMIASIICWFTCYNEIMTSDKFIYLFGRIIPSLSLVFSMVLRFVPKFTAQLKIVTNAQRCIGRDVSDGRLFRRVKHAIAILSLMISWSLENAIETADSMKSRGYGLSGRTAFSIFTFDKRDLITTVVILILGIYIFTGNYMDKMYFNFFPSMKMAEYTPMSASIFVAYFLLCALPIIIEIKVVRRWNVIKSKA